ncbi:MAG: hypothetical protein R6U61_08215 [Thermoplasmata archaeon]
MPRQKKSTAVHRSGHEKEIREILKDKGMREGFQEYTDIINQEFGTSLSTRQIRYYYNNYVKPREVIAPEEAEESIEVRRELINVAAEQMDLFELQKERVEKMLDVENISGDDKDGALQGEIGLASRLLLAIKHTKQDLGLMAKEPEKLLIDQKIEKEEQIGIDDLDSEQIKMLAMAMAGNYSESNSENRRNSKGIPEEEIEE